MDASANKSINEAAPRIWREEFKIHSYEIGPSGFVSPQAICRFLQEAATNHASRLSFSVAEMSERDEMWVLSNLSLRMEKFPRWHEQMQVETWPVFRASKLRAYRDFNLLDAAGARIGRASTMWILLSKSSRKPLKLAHWLAELASPGHEPELLRPVKETEFSGSPDKSQDFVIRGSDIDWNLHVNNVSYLEWALEGISARFRLQHKIRELDITYLAEGTYGKSIRVDCFSLANSTEPEFSTFLHRVSEQLSGKTLAMLRTEWQAAPEKAQGLQD